MGAHQTKWDLTCNTLACSCWELTASLSGFSAQAKPRLQRGGSSASLHNSLMRNSIFQLMIHTLDPLAEGKCQALVWELGGGVKAMWKGFSSETCLCFHHISLPVSSCGTSARGSPGPLACFICNAPFTIGEFCTRSRIWGLCTDSLLMPPA